MAHGKSLNERERITDEIFTSFNNEIGQRSTIFSKAGRDSIGYEQKWDRSKEQIRKRLLFIVPRNGLKCEVCNDDVCNALLDASKTILKNILEEALKVKRSHLVNSSGICHMFGARKRRNEGGRLNDSYIVVSKRTPLHVADIIDALRINHRFITTWIRQLLMERLASIERSGGVK
ncbi:unnamed protein product [Litomosoides sigmodontis]|uniref:Uncharacterized protein n=1 Tax=Litomosoides sigmodontis TaxID=42156 RepID=A0A3P6SGJ8_LITSI|nr:unnamed protein product [Litomosoides sigmodontis]